MQFISGFLIITTVLGVNDVQFEDKEEIGTVAKVVTKWELKVKMRRYCDRVIKSHDWDSSRELRR